MANLNVRGDASVENLDNIGPPVVGVSPNAAGLKIQANNLNGNYLAFTDPSGNQTWGYFTVNSSGTLTWSGNVNLSSQINTTDNIRINNSAPTITFADTDNRSAFIHVNSDELYILRGNGANSNYGEWTATNGYWPFTVNLENNFATFGGGVRAINSAYVERIYPTFGPYPGNSSGTIASAWAFDTGPFTIGEGVEVQIGPYLYLDNCPSSVHIVYADIAYRTWSSTGGTETRRDAFVVIRVKRRDRRFGFNWQNLRETYVQISTLSGNSGGRGRVNVMFAVGTDGGQVPWEYSCFAEVGVGDGPRGAVFNEGGSFMAIYTV